MHTNPVKQALLEGKPQFGCGYGILRSPDVARALAAAGFHWAFIDTEHGYYGIETVREVCRAAVESGLMPIVRVADLQYSLVSRALDCGAMGIVFPRVESRELLERAVSWTKFPPAGIRGYGLTPGHLDYEKATIPQVISHVNANTLVVLQIETKLALERREELISVPGVDAVMVGPADLSISLGIPGEFENPTLIEAVESVRDTCRRHGVAPGIHNRNAALAKMWKEKGMLFVGCNNETGMLFDAASAIIQALH
jgi:2-dehydro-3-deoxyglucarate aldolase/4-hydroxy-2-oxoheptanedioate aldolase